MNRRRFPQVTLPSDPANIQHAVWPIQRDTGLDIATIVDDVIESYDGECSNCSGSPTLCGGANLGPDIFQTQ